MPPPKSHKTMHRFLFVCGTLAILLLLTTGAAWGYDAYDSGHVVQVYSPTGQFVAVSGARMHYQCLGSGESTLVLEAGIGGGALDWTPVLPALSQHQRVCAFDRLGQDWSDPAPHPRDFGTAADELHGTLQTLNITRPVVVGHSLGGALAQVYAARYPVAGVALVEGLTSDVVDPVTARLGSYQALDLLAHFGLLRPLAGMLMVNPAYAPELQAEMLALRSRSSALLGVSDEGAVAARSAGALLRAAEPKLSMPVLVIAAEQSDVPGLTAGAYAGAGKALSARLPHATFVLVPGAKHYVQAEQPAVVVAAIEQWLAANK